MPKALTPTNKDNTGFYSQEAWKQFRLSSKSHWDVVIELRQQQLHFLVSHPTPPVFDKEDDHNGDYLKTLTICHSTVGKAILNTSITIVFGFSILVLSKFIPTIYFGLFTGLAMLLAMISVLTLLPSLILTVKPFGK